MSKSLLSRIKPLCNQKPNRSPPSSLRVAPRIKELVIEVCEILRTQNHWEQNLETRLSEAQVVPSEIAHLVFDKIQDAELGLKFFDWVSQRPYGCPLDGFAYSSLLKLLAKFRAFPEIEALLLDSTKCEETLPTREAFCHVIQACSNSGLVDKALELYSFVLKTYNLLPDIVACNSLLHALVNNGRVEVARRVYNEMVRRDNGIENHCLDNYSTCIIVRGLCKEGKVDEGRKLIRDRWGKDCVPNIVFYNILIDGYCKRGDIQSAYKLFQNLNLMGFLPTVETYGAMINGFCKEGSFEKVDELLRDMVARGLSVNVHVNNTIINAKYRHGFALKPLDVIRKMLEEGCEPDLVTYNTLISASCKAGKIEEAEKLLGNARDRGLVPNKRSYTPLMHVYCTQGDIDKASDLLLKMAELGDPPDLSTYGAFIHGFVHNGHVDVALTILDRMIEKGVLPDSGIYNVLMNGLCKKGKLLAAKQLLSEMLCNKILPDMYIYATLLDGIIRSGELNEAKKHFEHALEKGVNPGVVGHNAMIKGYCKFGMMNEAVLCVCRMKKMNTSPDEYTYSTIIDGFAKQHNLGGALTTFCQMVKQKCLPNVVTYTSLINGFCHIGDFQRALKYFHYMQSNGLIPNVVTYTILIGGFCKDGELAKAASLFERMLISKCCPNDFTFNYLVNGFSNYTQSVVLKEGNNTQNCKKSMFLDAFKRMISDGWLPQTAAYNSIIICLSLHGMLTAALQLQGNMASKGLCMDSVSFAALLHGICLDGKSKEWKSIIPCNLNEPELCTALNYSQIFDQYLAHGMNFEASVILQNLVNDYHSSLYFSLFLLLLSLQAQNGRENYSWSSRSSLADIHSLQKKHINKGDYWETAIRRVLQRMKKNPKSRVKAFDL
nr:pentatricopeptide repeat-containing protein At1g52620 [Ipomoea batatas]